MSEPLDEQKAIDWIGYVASYKETMDRADWEKTWHSNLNAAIAQVKNPTHKIRGVGALQFLTNRFREN